VTTIATNELFSSQRFISVILTSVAEPNHVDEAPVPVSAQGKIVICSSGSSSDSGSGFSSYLCSKPTLFKSTKVKIRTMAVYFFDL
jgi:hypothetical protein